MIAAHQRECKCGHLFRFVGYPEANARVLWVDWIKVVAAFAVVMTHVASIAWHNLDPNTPHWHVTSFFEIATRFCVPFFFIASGALLLNPKRDTGVKTLYGKYIPRAVIALVVSSFLFAALEAYLTGWTGWRNVILRAVDGPYFVWYLWVLIGLYVLTPIFRRVASDRYCLRYSVYVLAVLILGKSTVQAMFSGSILDVMFQNIIIVSRGAEGVFYFLLGAVLASHEFSDSRRLPLYVAGGGSLILALFLNWRHAVLFGLDSYFVARDNILIAVYSVALVEFFRRLSRGCLNFAPPKLLLNTGLLIYLVHPFFRLVIEVYVPSIVAWLHSSPLFAITSVSVFIYVCSFVTSLGILRVWLLLRSAMMGLRRG